MILHLFRKFAGLPFKLDRVNEAASGRVTGAELRASLPSLLKSGQLTAVRKSYGERLFSIPPACIPSLWNRLAPAAPEPVHAPLVLLVKESGKGLAGDLFRTLSWIGQYGLPVTSKGTIHRKAIGKLTDLLSISEPDVSPLGLRYAHQDVYPAQLAVVLDMLFALGLLDQETGSVRLLPERLSAWLSQDPAGMDAILLRELMARYLPDDPAVWHIAYRMMLPDLPLGAWLSVESLLQSIIDCGMLTGFSRDQQDWLQGWMQALSAFGWLDLGKDEAGAWMLRWRRRPGLQTGVDSGEEDGQATVFKGQEMCYVQPDFEILVPPDVPFNTRWELECCCECMTTDTMSIYRLTRRRAAHAYGLGRSPADLLELLTACSREVPDNVVQTLLDWERDLKRDMSGQTLSDYSYPRLIKQDESSFKFFPTMHDQAWIQQGQCLHVYERTDEVPGAEELFPGNASIPSMWIRERRSYHSSTARSMLLQAILWRTGVELVLTSGESAFFIPAQIAGVQEWTVRGTLVKANGTEQSGEEDVLLGPDAWDRMGLHMPLLS